LIKGEYETLPALAKKKFEKKKLKDEQAGG
jgi:hypothetical protein